MISARVGSRAALVALSLAAPWAVELAAASAATAQQLVIPGYGPPDAGVAPGQARPYRAATFPPRQPSVVVSEPSPGLYERPGYRQTPYPRAQAADGGSNYGGGFIEFMMTGHAGPATAPVHAAPAYAAPTYAAPAYGAAIHAAPVAVAPRSGLPQAGLPDYAPMPPAYYPGARQHQASYDPLEANPGLAARPIDPMYQRQEVAYAGRERPGTIVIDTPQKFLFLVEPGGHALRYGIGVGRPGFAWAGAKTITRKAEWPDWTPPPEMLLRRPDLPRHMEGGPANPLGARALYLGSSLYRIHGTNEPYTIGTNVSSGCIRMMNDDVIDLYGRVGVGTHVIVM